MMHGTHIMPIHSLIKQKDTRTNSGINSWMTSSRLQLACKPDVKNSKGCPLVSESSTNMSGNSVSAICLVVYHFMSLPPPFRTLSFVSVSVFCRSRLFPSPRVHIRMCPPTPSCKYPRFAHLACLCVCNADVSLSFDRLWFYSLYIRASVASARDADVSLGLWYSCRLQGTGDVVARKSHERAEEGVRRARASTRHQATS